MFSKKTMKAVDVASIVAAYTPGEPVRVKELSALLGVSTSYLESILSDLKQHGLVTTTRGHTGGYQLRSDPNGQPCDFSLWDVVCIFEVPAHQPQRLAGDGYLLDVVNDHLDQDLERICRDQRLADLAAKLILPERQKAAPEKRACKLKHFSWACIPHSIHTSFEWIMSMGAAPLLAV